MSMFLPNQLTLRWCGRHRGYLPPHNFAVSWLPFLGWDCTTKLLIESEYQTGFRNARRAIAVASITLDLSGSQFQKLQDLATVHGIALAVLLKASLEDWLNSQKSEFVDAANYVLTKNTELYQRLT